jgi:transglutaminase-like putative cysteine protease
MTILKFGIGCELSYSLSGSGAFIMNVSVANNLFQRILSEQFITTPQLQVEEYFSPVEKKRQHRFWAAANVPETSRGELPAEVVPYLYPSRYCESDKLVRLAQHEFGKLQPGFFRVTAICNWIHSNVE